ncbi:hypothetical protein JCGZ_12638 [Jatropha curcas]|uniref:Uncharacterized protein n=1 Tax=Jatropha curcas TaxID=180498 RepID=A0A067KS00_JATCU|nr:hypothetical protein JCGZ_12638 [Jatropha curcas]
MEEILDPALAPRSNKENAQVASATRGCARNLHPKKASRERDINIRRRESRPESQKHLEQKSRAHLPSARARASTFERQKVCQRSSRARLPYARARKELLRGRRLWSKSREHDLYKRERESRFPEDVIDALSSEDHIFPCKGRDAYQEKSLQTPLGQPITTKTTITLLLYK